jgi:hypothetical protein
MLATSLPVVGRAENLDVQVSFETNQSGNSEMLLSLLLSSVCGDQTLCVRLTTLTEGSATLPTALYNGAELALTSAWQLASAMGERPSIETTTDQKVRVQVLLPLVAALSPLSENGTGRASIETDRESGQPSDSNGGYSQHN